MASSDRNFHEKTQNLDQEMDDHLSRLAQNLQDKIL